MTESIWTRQRAAAPARENLSREQIVRTAMELLDTEGLAGLSMRKLATKLGSGATSLYWYVPTKVDLIDLLIDEIWGEIDVPEPELAGWRSGALLFGHSLRSAVLRHPWLPEVMYTRPSMGPNAIKLGQRCLVLFGAAGFTGPDTDYAMSCVMSYVLGSASAEVAVHAVVRKAGTTLDEWAHEMMRLAQDSTKDHPEMQESLRRRSGRDVSTMHNETFVFGLDTILEGLENRLKK
jgi:AcrR family transcriptional regulator